jgi:hypothetical protein
MYFSPNIFQVTNWRMIRWAQHVAHMGEKRNACRVLIEKYEGKTTWKT